MLRSEPGQPRAWRRATGQWPAARRSMAGAMAYRGAGRGAGAARAYSLPASAVGSGFSVPLAAAPPRLGALLAAGRRAARAPTYVSTMGRAVDPCRAPARSPGGGGEVPRPAPRRSGGHAESARRDRADWCLNARGYGAGLGTAGGKAVAVAVAPVSVCAGCGRPLLGRVAGRGVACGGGVIARGRSGRRTAGGCRVAGALPACRRRAVAYTSRRRPPGRIPPAARQGKGRRAWLRGRAC